MPRLLFAIGLLTALLGRGSAEEPKRLDWNVEGVKREAIVFATSSASTTPAPLLFVFHGHGGTTGHAARNYAFQKHWPEAIVVYMQGLPTPGHLTDPEGKKPGWQKTVGDQNDRDLKFFDAVLTTMKKDYKVDEKRIYVTGHSNGGAFTYLLWGARGDVFAAVAPSGTTAAKSRPSLKPKSVLHAAGENDPLVKFEWQKVTIEQIKKLNGCESQGKPAGKYCTEYASKSGTPVVTLIYPGGHAFPEDTPARIVQFFKEQK